ncbi:hypothetical protein T484DRAFT_1771842 [Baffinella frigidus]|nr:hypothetical protein T484DRAFT_1771842 [Cryptophyta sp. CCMP2293]
MIEMKNQNTCCHVCQHAKVGASSTLACENKECCSRFCEHCLIALLGETVEPDMSSDAWSMVSGKAVWKCPICRSKCCCSAPECRAEHRHCKAYRYRRRRAEQASQRVGGLGGTVGDTVGGEPSGTFPGADTDVDNWVLCEACSKWRRVGADIDMAASFECDMLPGWTCAREEETLDVLPAARKSHKKKVDGHLPTGVSSR